MVGMAACGPGHDLVATESGEILDPDPVPCLEVTPHRVNFEPLMVGRNEARRAILTVGNACEGLLRFEGAELTTSSAPFRLNGLNPGTLAMGETTTFDVLFTPRTSGTFQAGVVLSTNDSQAIGETVRVSGTGIAPVLDVDPEQQDLGIHWIGCRQSVPITLRNDGTADLIIDSILPYTPSVDEFSIDLDLGRNRPLPFVLAPFDATEGGPSITVSLNHVPLDTFRDDANVEIRSNDPFAPVTVLAFSGNGKKYRDSLDVFEDVSGRQVDVVVTVDRESDAAAIRQLVRSYPSLHSSLMAGGADVHLAAIVADDGCPTTDWITSADTPSAAATKFGTLVDASFALAPRGDLSGRGLDLVAAALSGTNLGAGGCLEGFRREHAHLAVVHVSDRKDSSARTWAYYVSLLQDTVREPDQVRFHAIGGPYPSGCDGAESADGYYEATVATGGSFTSICTEDWPGVMADLGARLDPPLTDLALDDRPVPQTLEAKVDGIRFNVGWAYDPASNAIVFEPAYSPPAGSTVEVFYEVLHPECRD